MPLSPNLLEQFVFLQLNQAPGPLLDLISAVGFRAMTAALRLGVFEALAAGPLSAADLARQSHLSERGAVRLLELLASLGYLKRDGEKFANTPMTARWLLKNAPATFAPGMLFWGATLEQLWGDLEESISTGEPPTHLYEWIEHQPEVSQNFQEWMVSLARVAGGEIAQKVARAAPPNARHALDVGGGHAMYSVALCKQLPALTSVVIDSAQALNTARNTVANEGMQDRVTLRPGNFMQDDLGEGYDLVLLFNIIHGFRAEENAALLRRTAAALNPGGLVVVAEQLAGRTLGPATRGANAMFGLAYFHLLGGGVYSFEQVKDWLTRAGFGGARRIDLLKAPGSSLVLGTKGA